MAAGRHYYTVVRRSPSTISCVVALAVHLSATIAWGQQPKKGELGPIPLLPLQPAWSLTLAAPPAAGGAMDGERIYVPVQPDQILALDRQTGRTVWAATVITRWTPVVAGRVLIVASSDSVHALDAVSGERVWMAPRTASGQLVFAEGLVIVPEEPGQLFAIAAATGAPVWTAKLGGTPGSIALGAGYGAAYAVVDDGRVMALSLADGRIRWDIPLAGAVGAPALGRDRVVVATASEFVAFDARGKRQWLWNRGGKPVGAAASGDLVFLTLLDNSIRAVNRSDGHQRWRKTLPTRPQHAPIAANRLVVVPGISPGLSGFAIKDGVATGTHASFELLVGSPLIDMAIRPYTVAVVAILNDGTVSALRPEAMMFTEPTPAPLTVLPGRALAPERLPVTGRPR